MKDENQEHPTPDVLVDLVEGGAVDASWIDHVSRCARCKTEVTSLWETLESVSADEVPEPGEEYWDGFNSRLKSRIHDVSAKPLKPWVWAAAAAAVVATGLWTSPYWEEAMRPSPAESLEVILPPVDEDDEYQALLSFAEISIDTEKWVEAFENQSVSGFDPSQLTADEEEELRQKLERDIEGMDHAKS